MFDELFISPAIREEALAVATASVAQCCSVRKVQEIYYETIDRLTDEREG